LVGSGALNMPPWGWVVLIVLAAGAIYGSIRYGSRLEDWLLSRIHRKKEER